MASVVSICNLALGHLGVSRINALTDRKREAELCSEFYESSRDSVLRAHEWGFAEKRRYVALSDEDAVGFEYAYSYPSDCLKARQIQNLVEPNEPIYFKTVSNEALTGKLIYTDEEQAILVYTAKVTDPNMFDALFIDALAYKLAWDICYPLTNKNDREQAMMVGYTRTLALAQAVDANESKPDPSRESKYRKARR